MQADRQANRQTHYSDTHCMQNNQFATFWVWGPPQMVPVTLKFKLTRDFCTMHLPNKFHYPVINHSEVIV